MGGGERGGWRVKRGGREGRIMEGRIGEGRGERGRREGGERLILGGG
jgi:hypothetical protein